MVFWEALKFALVGFGLCYVGLVGITYRRDGPSPPLKVSPDKPFYSVESFLVWIGVRAADVALRAGRGALEPLFEASAEVGEWYVRRRGVEAKAQFKSRHL